MYLQYYIRHTLSICFDPDLVLTIPESEVYQVRLELAAAYKGRQGGRVLQGQDEPWNLQRARHVYLQDRQRGYRTNLELRHKQ